MSPQNRLVRAGNTFIQSTALYPITTVYLGAVIGLLLVADRRSSVPAAVAVLAILAMLTVCVSTMREVHTVHLLVNSARDAQLERIDQLLATLTAADVPVPPDPRSEP